MDIPPVIVAKHTDTLMRATLDRQLRRVLAPWITRRFTLDWTVLVNGGFRPIAPSAMSGHCLPMSNKRIPECPSKTAKRFRQAGQPEPSA